MSSMAATASGLTSAKHCCSPRDWALAGSRPVDEATVLTCVVP